MGCWGNEDTAWWDVKAEQGRGTLGHIQLCLSVGTQVTKRTCGLMLHLEVCLVLDNYNQEGDGYAMQR